MPERLQKELSEQQSYGATDSVSVVIVTEDGELEKQNEALETQVTASVEATPIEEFKGINSQQPASESASFCSVFKTISWLAIPMGGSFTFSFSLFFSGLALQWLSENDEDRAAIALIATLMGPVCNIFTLPLLSLGVILSELVGRWRTAPDTKETIPDVELDNVSADSTLNLTKAELKKKIQDVSINALFMGSVLVIPPTLILFYSKSVLVNIFNQDEHVAKLAQDFLRVFSAAVLGLMARISFEQGIFAVGQTRKPMIMALSSLSVGVTLSFLLGFGVDLGFVQFPKLRSQGVAIGLVVEAYLTASSYGLFLFFSKACKPFSFFEPSLERVRGGLSELKKVLYLAGTVTYTCLFEISSSMSLAILSGLLKEEIEAQAAISYCLQLFAFESIFYTAFSLSCMQQVKRELGAGKIEMAKATSQYGLLTTLIYLSPIPFLFAIYPKALEAVSGGASEEVSTILSTLVPIMSLGIVLETLRYNLQKQSWAFKDLLIPSIMISIGVPIGIGLSTALGLFTSFGVNGIGLGYDIGIGLTGGALFWRCRQVLNQLSPAQNPKEPAAVPPTNEGRPEIKAPSFCDRLFTFFGFSQESAPQVSRESKRAAETTQTP